MNRPVAWINRLVASFGGVGFCPVAPGTAGSAAAVLVGAGLMQGGIWVLPAAAVLATVLGLLAIPRAVTDRTADPGWVVIDEVAGQWVAMLGLGAASPIGLLAAFAGFRILDIWKPGPVGWADRQHGALGIMADDVIAGAVVALMLLAVRWIAPALLGGTAA